MAGLPVRQKKSKRAQVKGKSANDPKNKAGAWQFVNSHQSDASKDAEVRKLVRVNAMRHYRKGQRERRQHDQPKAAVDILDPLPDPAYMYLGRPHLQSCQEKLTKYDESPWLIDLYEWPNDWERLLKEVRVAMKNLTPTGHDKMLLLNAMETDLERDIALRRKVSETKENLAVDPQPYIGNGSSDPFDSFPIKEAPTDSEYLFHCKLILWNKSYTPICLISIIGSLY